MAKRHAGELAIQSRDLAGGGAGGAKVIMYHTVAHVVDALGLVGAMATPRKSKPK